MRNRLANIQRDIEFWNSYVEYHIKVYSSKHMPKAWSRRMANINEKILEWRLEEVKILKEYPNLYKRKMKLIENLFYQVEYHQCEKERIIKKHYETDECLDYGMVVHHQREALAITEELHFELLKAGLHGICNNSIAKPDSVMFNSSYEG